MPAKLIEIEEARRLVLERVTPLDAEKVALRDALGRVLAEDVESADAVPGFDNSAMDGYAVRAADTGGASADAPVELRLADESRAGSPAVATLAEGEAIAISTGAAVPEGADSVVRVEDTASNDSRVEIKVEVEAGRNVRRAGEDIEPGETVLRSGTPIGAAELGVLASIGRTSVLCRRRPRVHVLSTGDELIEPGEPLTPGAVRNSNSYTVPPLAAAAGAEVTAVEIVPDDPESTRQAIAGALEADLVVICGGVSVGPHDHVRPALAELEAKEVFWGVSLKPGKPTWFGVAPSGALVFGLPGNPVSAMVTFLLFARPGLLAMVGLDPAHDRASAILEDEIPKKPGRTQAVRCSLELGDDGWHATSTGAQGSHVLTSMLGADALAILPADAGDVPAGTRVEIEFLPRGLLSTA